MNALIRELTQIADAAGIPANMPFDGGTIRFASYEALATGTTEAQHTLLGHVMMGAGLSLEASLGRDLPFTPDQVPNVFVADGWYGYVPGVLVAGPYSTRGQALTGAVLVIAGLDVVPDLGLSVLQADDAEDDVAESPWADLVDLSRVPEELRAECMAETVKGFEAMGLTPDVARAMGIRATAVPAEG